MSATYLSSIRSESDPVETPIGFLIGAKLVEAAAQQAVGSPADRLRDWEQRLRRHEAEAHLQQICNDAERLSRLTGS